MSTPNPTPNPNPTSNQPPAAPPPPPPPRARNTGARRLGLGILALVVLLAGVGYGFYWFSHGRYFESTDDAYINGDVVQISSEQPGTVLAVHVDDTQPVAAGAALVDLDPADARVAMSNAEAELARTVRQVRGLFAQDSQLRAQIEQRESALSTAESDLKRRQGLLDDGAISGEELSHARDNVISARAAVAAAREQLAQTVAQTQGTRIDNHPQVLAAAAAVRNAALALHRTHLVAPVSGVVAKRNVQVGQRIAAGTPLLAVVPLDDVWIDANFKEGQLARMRAGQAVTVDTDVYGGKVEFHGHLVGFGAGSGSAFALLPAQNASGNWIKIVQRVPVRVLLDPQELKDHPLRIGLSARVKVDLRDSSSEQASGVVRNTAQPVQTSAGDDPEVEAQIARIIAENSGPNAGA
jgi:membrane fusion protein (multidrug efflux system)